MDLLKRINERAQAIRNTGFGTNPESYGGRLVKKDGLANIEKRGISFLDGISWYHTMIDMPIWKFITIVLTFYFGINFIFALIYFGIGIEHLDGISSSDNSLEQFGKAYFFSAQTFTTVGYGHISPVGFLTSALSSIEALFGLLSFAIATGLFFGRFSKPTAFIKFSDNALIAPYGESIALMMRLVPHKNTNFTDAEAKLTLGLSTEEDGKMVNKFYALDLELERVNSLNLSWTIVHPITENSPLYGFLKEDFKSLHGEVILYIKTFDDMYSTIVATRTSYTFEEIIYGAKFIPMYTRNSENSKTTLDIDKLNSYENV